MRNEVIRPKFICIGVCRGGSTTLWDYFYFHPNFVPPRWKEAQFFDICYGNGLDYYWQNFPYKQDGFTGDVSPTYFTHPFVPGRIHKDMQEDVKFILLLRNPVDRAYSAYVWIKHHKSEWLSFEDAIKQEPKRLNYPHRECKDANYLNYGYLREGRYVEHLERWFDVFPKEQFLIVKSEDFWKQPQVIFDRILDFLGEKKYTIKEVKKLNGLIYSPMEGKTREELIEYFKPYNERLYKLIGRDMKWQ